MGRPDERGGAHGHGGAGARAPVGGPKLRVKPGRHKFEVQAIDEAGNTDGSPAKQKFKVKR